MRRYVFRLVLLSCAVLGMSTARGDDQQIAQQILTKLQAEKQAGALKGFSIDLQVDEGTVWLSGRVASSEQQAKALDLARRVPGVKQVVDDLTIAAPAPKNVASRPAPTPAQAPTPAMAYNAPPAAAPQIVEMPAPPVQVANTPVPMVQAVPQETANQVASKPSASSSSRKSASSSNGSVLGNVSKSLASVVSSNRQEEPQPVSRSVQPASVSGDVSAAIGGPVGSGVDPSTASSRRNALTAQPIAAVPQMVAPAEGLQPLNPAHPQMAAMVPVPYMMPYYPYPPMQPQVPLAMGPARAVNYTQPGPVPAYGPVAGPVPADGMSAAPAPMYMPGSGVGIAPARYDHPTMPGYAWPSYACYPNYGAVTYPKQYSPTAWPYIGPFYPYPQVPLGWRKVTLEWDDGWWMLDFKDRRSMYNH